MAWAAHELGIRRRPPKDSERQAAEMATRLGRQLPGAVRALLAYDGLIETVARAYDAQPGLAHGRLLTPPEMPGVEGDVLWLVSENQGVCTWGVALDEGDDPPVLVGGELPDSATSPVRYADDLATFLSSWAWDLLVQDRTPLVQAGSGPLDDGEEAFLAARFDRRWTTWGYPCRRSVRFESAAGVRVLLWASDRGTDWTISGPDGRATESCVHELLAHFDLQAGFGAHDDAGIALLERARAARRSHGAG